MSVSSPRFSIFKRANGVYYIGYYSNGRRRWKSTGSRHKPDALRGLTQFKQLLEEPTRLMLEI